MSKYSGNQLKESQYKTYGTSNNQSFDEEVEKKERMEDESSFPKGEELIKYQHISHSMLSEEFSTNLEEVVEEDERGERGELFSFRRRESVKGVKGGAQVEKGSGK